MKQRIVLLWHDAASEHRFVIDHAGGGRRPIVTRIFQGLDRLEGVGIRELTVIRQEAIDETTWRDVDVRTYGADLKNFRGRAS